MIPPRLYVGSDAGRSTLSDLLHLGEVAPVADRMAETWRRAIALNPERANSPLRAAIEQHELEAAQLFAKGVRLAHLGRALAVRGVTTAGRPLTVHGFSMAWRRAERSRPARLAAERVAA